MVRRCFETNWSLPATPENPFDAFGVPKAPYNGAGWQIDYQRDPSLTMPGAPISRHPWRMRLHCRTLERAWEIASLLKASVNVYANFTLIPKAEEGEERQIKVRPTEPNAKEEALMT